MRIIKHQKWDNPVQDSLLCKRVLKYGRFPKR